VTPDMENRKFFACFISGDIFSINTLLIHKHLNILKSKLNVLSNNQIQYNLYLTVGTAMKLGRFIKVIKVGILLNYCKTNRLI
jgi:hypothetical protein